MEWVLWWHWVVIGVLLIVAEIFVVSFFIIWLGIAAVIVGIVDLLFAITVSNQLYLWSVLSVILLLLWFVYFNKSKAPEVGQSESEYAHIKGEITDIVSKHRYKAFFELPVLGDRSWIVESNEELKPGDTVEVSEVYGQIIKVKKIKG